MRVAWFIVLVSVLLISAEGQMRFFQKRMSPYGYPAASEIFENPFGGPGPLNWYRKRQAMFPVPGFIDPGLLKRTAKFAMFPQWIQ
uniref:Uncharacterized protein n=1 Tax=Steinernema glaseri TaxID=37863 RepID=A0A1I7ZGQ4_9BILA